MLKIQETGRGWQLLRDGYWVADYPTFDAAEAARAGGAGGG